MTTHARLRRIGWFALLTVCTLLYGLLHLQVWSVSSEVKRSERQIVALVRTNRLLDTEFNTRASQMNLAAWNRVDFGYVAPSAQQFIGNERDLAAFGVQGEGQREDQMRLAAFSADEEAPPFPQLLSPITGEPVDAALVRPAAPADGDAAGDGAVGDVIAAAANGPASRRPLDARQANSGTVRVMLGGGQ